MLDQHLLENSLKKNYIVYERFTFDRVFRFLLLNGYEHEEAKDIILHNCALSTLVLQERIHNEYYYEISMDDGLSKDLVELRNEIIEKIFTFKGKEFERFCDYLSNKRMNISENYQNDQGLDRWDSFSSNTNDICSSGTYEKNVGKMQAIYDQLEQALGVKVEPAPDEWDRL